jgi:hypothetical protein
VGTVNGTADGAQTSYGTAVGSINLSAGNSGVNYNFLDSFAGS